MKTVVRWFFRTVRVIMAPIMIAADRLTRPKGIVRPPAEQARVEAAVAGLALYHFPSCPFCIKTRREMARLSLPIELRDAQHDPQRRQELLEGGGEVKVPCLRIEEPDGSVRWMYESDDIISYLRSRFAPGAR